MKFIVASPLHLFGQQSPRRLTNANERTAHMLPKRLSTVLFTSALGVVSVAAVGCSSSTSSTPPSPSASASTSSSDSSGYTTEAQQQYVEGCANAASKDGKNPTAQATALCECSWRGFKQTVPFDQFLALSNDSTASSPPELSAVVEKCVGNPNAYLELGSPT